MQARQRGRHKWGTLCNSNFEQTNAELETETTVSRRERPQTNAKKSLQMLKPTVLSLLKTPFGVHLSKRKQIGRIVPKLGAEPKVVSLRVCVCVCFGLSSLMGHS